MMMMMMMTTTTMTKKGRRVFTRKDTKVIDDDFLSELEKRWKGFYHERAKPHYIPGRPLKTILTG
jgi:hypothetical protein